MVAGAVKSVVAAAARQASMRQVVQVRCRALCRGDSGRVDDMCSHLAGGSLPRVQRHSRLHRQQAFVRARARQIDAQGRGKTAVARFARPPRRILRRFIFPGRNQQGAVTPVAIALRQVL